MKRILSLILICFVCIGVFFACGKDDKDIQDVKTKINEDIKDDYSRYFTDGELTNTMQVVYSNDTDKNGSSLSTEINSNITADKTDNQLRFIALNKVYQPLMNYIMNYYEKWNESLYLQNVSKKDATALYKAAKKYENALENFDTSKSEFENSVKILNDVKLAPTFAITKFTYNYNMLIESQIEFVGKFISLHKKYVTYPTTLSEGNMERLVDEAYYNVACFVYYENVKVFEYNVGNNGICDLSNLMREYSNGSNEYVKLNYIQGKIKDLNSTLIDDISNPEASGYAIETLNNFIYSANVYNQRLEVYLSAYENIDMYGLSNYRFNNVANANVDNFISRFSVVEMAQYELLCNFADEVFVDYYNNLITVI